MLLFASTNIFSQTDECIKIVCPDPIVVCAENTTSGYGYLFDEQDGKTIIPIPDVSYNCGGFNGQKALIMNFELNAALLGKDCWNFNYISRVGGDGGHVKLFSSNNDEGVNYSYITTPYLYINPLETIDIDV